MSSEHTPQAAAQVAKATKAGLPASVVTSLPERAHNPVETRALNAQLDRVLNDPEGVPVHHTEIDVEKRHEELTPGNALGADRTWFYLGMVYTLIPGLDTSLFELYRHAGAQCDVRSHRGEQPIVDIIGANFAMNHWAYIIQGVEHSHVDTFKKFIASYRFKQGDNVSDEMHTPGEVHWLVDWITVRIADPLFPRERRGVEVNIALPINETTQRGVAIAEVPGLMLGTPKFKVTNLGAPDA